MNLPIPKNIVRTLLWSGVTVALLVSLGFSSREQAQMACKGLRIHIVDQTGNYFVDPAQVRELLNSTGRKLKGSHMADINMGVLEKIVYSNPYVGKAEVYSSIDGYVTIDVWQRDPIMRIINNDNEHFYVDETGVFMPVSDQYTKPVIVASGHIFDGFKQKSLAFASVNPADSTQKPVLVQLNELALYLQGHPFWDAQIEQMYVTEENEIELIPRVGDHIILLGTTDDLDRKMDNLFVFYTQAMQKAGWNQYSTINLKFKNQVVCTRKQAKS